MAVPTRLSVAAALFVLAAAAACTHAHEARPVPTTTSTSAAPPPSGGSVRVAMWGMPDPAAPTLAGAAVRALVLPQLFVAGPDGRWRPSLVDPGSVQVAADALSASFRLRGGAVWSDGSPIGAEDLRRSADARWVAAIEGPSDAGRITVRFKERMPGWQRLWSGSASVSPPAAGVWGGPFVVASTTPGLETVLRRNPKWWDAPRPYLDEVRLVLVPEATMQRQLFERRMVDVVAPLAYSNRRGQYTGEQMAGAGGWDVRLVMKGVDALAATVPRRPFVETLLADEAEVGAGPEPSGDVGGLKGRTVVLTGEVEEPMTAALERAMQKKVAGAGGTLELRNAEADRVEGWVAAGDYEAAVVVAYEPPGCEGSCGAWPGASSSVSLWRPLAMVASAPGINGVQANPWALSPAWNAWEWSRLPSS